MATKLVFNPLHGTFDLVQDVSGFLPLAGGTMTGDITLANTVGSLKSGNYPIQFKSFKADGAGAVAFHFDTNVSFGATARPFKFSIAGVEQMWLGSSMGAFGGTSNNVTAGYAFGQSNTNSAAYTTTFGYGNTSGGNGAVAMGLSNTAGGLYSAAIGFNNIIAASAIFPATIGAFNTIDATGYVVGQSNRVYTGGGVIIGNNCSTYGESLAMGKYSVGGSASGAIGSAVGYACIAYGTNSFAMGNTCVAWGANSFAAGGGARNTIDNSFMFGTGSITDTAPGIFVSSSRSNFDTSRVAIARNTGVGSEILTNGTFNTDASGWTLGADWSWSSGKLIKAAGASSGTVTQAVSGLTVGKVYVLAYKITFGTAEDQGQYVTPSFTGGFSLTFGNRSRTMIVSHKEVFIATATSATLTFTVTGATITVTSLDDISLKPATTGDLSVAGTSYLNAVSLLNSNVTFGTTTGTKLGTATTEKLGFWNATPIVQPTTASAAATLTGGGGTALTDTDTFDGYTLKQVVKALRDTGLLA